MEIKKNANKSKLSKRKWTCHQIKNENRNINKNAGHNESIIKKSKWK